MVSGEQEIEGFFVFDTRPLINTLLAGNVGLLELACAGRIVTTSSVRAEFLLAAATLCAWASAEASLGDPHALQIADACTSWPEYLGDCGSIRIEPLTDAEERISLDLEEKGAHTLRVHSAEADVLGLCVQRGWVAVLDDYPARMAALALDVATLGSVELLVRAVRRGGMTHKEGEEALDRMRGAFWDRAPMYSLRDVLDGRVPIWPGT